MTTQSFQDGAPRTILLATDLSARADRALERAVAIAQRHDARLVIVHAFEEIDEAGVSYVARGFPSWRRPPDVLATMKRKIGEGLRADLGDAIERATIHIEEGDPAEVIERTAAAEQADLVITGIARESPFASRPVVLGKTVEQLLRRLPVPVLIVRNRARSAYQRIVVATDFSESSAHALQMALRFFPNQSLDLLHASEAPYSTLVDDAGLHADRYRAARADEMREFLASTFMSDDDRQRLVKLIEPGSPRQLVRDYVQVHHADLVVLGTHGRGAIQEALLGSTAKSILATLPCDALVVRGPR